MLNRVSILTLIVLGIATLATPSTANAQTTWHVDDNAPNDPGPGDPTVSDPLEDGSPEHPFDAVQEGIDAASDGDTVLVANGIYTGTGNKDLDFVGKAITVRSASGDPAECVIDCEGDGRGFYFHSGEGADSIVEGLTITNGSADEGGGIYCSYSSPTFNNSTISGNLAIGYVGLGGGINCRDGSNPTLTNCTISGNSAIGYYFNLGGGINCRDGSSPTLNSCTINGNSADGGGAVCCDYLSSPTLSNCTISGNSADLYGGGVHCCDDTSNPTLTNCTISENSASDGGGVYCSWSSSPTLTNCTISGNAADNGGGGVHCYYGSPTLNGCTISDNSACDGGGVCCWYSSNPTLTNCTISDNSAIAFGGGIFNWDTSPTLTNCTISGNSAGSNGGGVYCYLNSNATLTSCTISGNSAGSSGGGLFCHGDSSPTLSNCTISGNASEYDGGGVCCWNSGPSLTNCILWGDTPQEICVYTSSPVVTYCDVQGGWAGTGNIDDDPLFVDPDGPDDDSNTWEDNDYHLTVGSPCVDAGDPGYVSPPADTDTDGQPRVMDGDVDGVWRVDMGADEKATFYASNAGNDEWDGLAPTWDGEHGPKLTIQAGIDATKSGETVAVADGTYTGLGNKNLDFGGKAITMRSASGDPTLCIIDCELDGRGFHFHSGETPASVLEGITITHANGSDSGEYAEAILCEASSPTISNCSIVDNSDGGIHCYDSDVTIEGCHIARNYNSGIYSEDGAVTVVESTIAENSDGGVYAVSSASLLIADCVIHANESRDPGAGVYCCNCPGFVITRCVVSDNNTSQDSGGGILCYGWGTEVGLIDQCTIVGNTASLSGGGVKAAQVGPVLIRDCHIAGNTAGFYGGGLLAGTLANVSVVRTRIEENTASWGGGVATGADHFEAVDCEIRGNLAEEHGGGLYCFKSGWPGKYVELTNCVFADNVALEGDGGGLSCGDQINPTMLRNCTIVGNSAGNSGGGMHCETEMDVANSVFWDNDADLGSQLAIEDVDDPEGETLTFTNVDGGPSGIHVATGTLGWHESNIDADPLFVDPDGPDNDPNTWEDNDYHLSAGSPCIDAADNTAVPLDTLDLDEDGDTDERIPFDLDGNPRFVEDPFTDDTGVADPPYYRYIVDMGAYEFQFCFGDLDDDNDVDIADLAQLLGSYGETAGMTYYDGDLDGDGDVDLVDLAELLGVYGTVCE